MFKFQCYELRAILARVESRRWHVVDLRRLPSLPRVYFGECSGESSSSRVLRPSYAEARAPRRLLSRNYSLGNDD